MTYKLCASCGKHVRDSNPSCWKCGSTEFAAMVTPGESAPEKPQKPDLTNRLWAGAKAAAKGFSEETKRQRELREWGETNDALICPHCQTKGLVHTKQITRKNGISGAKVMGGLLTGGVSLLATGLSQKQGLTQAHCGNCSSTWTF